MKDVPTFAELARRVARGLARIEREQVCCDVTLQQFETLRVLHEAKDVTTGDLARRLGIDLSTASRNLAVLERQGYIARTRARDDGRQIANTLTRKGVRCVESLCCDERSVFDAILERIPAAERRAVLEALVTLSDALENVTPSASSCCPAPSESATKGASQ